MILMGTIGESFSLIDYVCLAASFLYDLADQTSRIRLQEITVVFDESKAGREAAARECPSA